MFDSWRPTAIFFENMPLQDFLSEHLELSYVYCKFTFSDCTYKIKFQMEWYDNDMMMMMMMIKWWWWCRWCYDDDRMMIWRCNDDDMMMIGWWKDDDDDMMMIGSWYDYMMLFGQSVGSLTDVWSSPRWGRGCRSCRPARGIHPAECVAAPSEPLPRDLIIHQRTMYHYY